MREVTLIGLTISHFVYVIGDDDTYLNYNVECGPHIDVISTDTNFAYIPYYVKLHRCQGKNAFSAPHGRNCVPTNKKTIKYTVALADSGVMSFITLSNHTDCEYRCENNVTSCAVGQGWHEETCSCCEKDEQCAGNFIWNRTKCRCECPAKRRCDGDYEWNREQCLCICPSTSKDNCGNLTPYPSVPTSLSTDNNNPNASRVVGETHCVKYQLVILIAVVEFVVITALSILVFYFCFLKRSEGRYHVSRKEKKHKHETRNLESVIRNREIGKNGNNNQHDRDNNVRVVYDRGNVNSGSTSDSVATIYDIDSPDRPVFVIKNDSRI